MTNTKLNFYFFGEIGDYDNYNPAYVCNQEYASEILYLIAKSEPFSISKFQISKILDIEENIVEYITSSLEFINAIEIKDSAYRTKFPIFLEEDIINIENCITNIGEIIGNRIIEMKDVLYKKVSELTCSKDYTYERILYHIICDKIFDGTAFEFFAEKNTFCVSKQQPGNRDYIIVAYEDSKLVEKHSNNILCSSNNYISSGFVFNSFGDSNGLRKDMYRFFRIAQKNIVNISQFGKVNISYNRILDNMNREIAYECGVLIRNIIDNKIEYSQLGENDKNLLQFLSELEYIDLSMNENTISINIPIFYDIEIDTIIKEISDIILLNIYPIVKEIFENFELKETKLTSIRHKVDIKETANELWHQIFGAANEYLVKAGFVACPDNIEGEGRYFRSFVMPRN